MTLHIRGNPAVPGSSEVNAINRQKFLAELAKLLTFMYEEDRRYALDMYERMFDIAEGSEQWLIQNLMSPTRQAVIIARSYDAKERKLSVSAEWKEDGDEDAGGETPPFVLAINKIFDDLFPDNEDSEETAEPDADQVSLFDNNGTGKKEAKRPKMPKAAVLLNQTQEFESITAEAAAAIDLSDYPEEDARESSRTYEEGADAEPDAETEPDPRVQIVDRAEFYDPAENQPDAGTGEASPESETDSETSPDETEPSGQRGIPQAKTDVETQLKETQPAGEQPKKRRSIEDLLGFRKEKKRSEDPVSTSSEPSNASEQATTEAGPAPADLTEKAGTEKVVPEAETKKPEGILSAETTITPQESSSAPQNPPETDDETKEPFFTLPDDAPVIRKPEPGKREEKEVPVRRVPKIPAMILFFIVAIPSVPVMLGILAVLVALCVSLSFGLIALGSVLVLSAFSGFAVLADILLLLGAAIIALALGLLFLWIGIWLIAEVMAGLIRSVGSLYREWCYKEVPAA